MNPHTDNITALSYGKLVHENLSQMELIRSLEVKVEMQKHLVLRAQEEQKRALEQRDHAHTQLAAVVQKHNTLYNDKNGLKAKLNDCREANKILHAHIETLENQLAAEKLAYTRMKARFHGLNYGGGQSSIKAQEKIEAVRRGVSDEMASAKTFCSPPTPEVDWIVKFTTKNQGIIKMSFSYGVTSAYLDYIMRKLGAISWDAILPHHCVNPTKPEPTWKAVFKYGDKVRGTYSWNRCPQDWELEQLRALFQANSWSLILP